MSRTRSDREIRKRIGAAIGLKTHVSSRRAQQLYLPMVRFVYDHDKEEYHHLADWLDAEPLLDSLLSSEAELAN